MENCKFCKLIRWEIPAWIVYEEENVIAFLPKEVEVYGHTLVVPKKHYADLYDIPYETLADISRISKMLTIWYKEKINATGMNLMHASGIDGEQSVYHFHMHLLPRFKDDGLHTRPTLPQIDVDKDELLKKIQIGG